MLDSRAAGSDRRTSPRASFVAAVRQEGGTKVGLALAQNIGAEGMELQLADETPLQAEVQLRFELPDGGGCVDALAEVVFVTREGKYQRAGVRFISLSTRDKARIVRVVNTR